MPSPDELADALYDWKWDDDGSGTVRVSLDDLRNLARDAAKQALLDAAAAMETHAGQENDEGVRVGVERWPDGESHGYSTAVSELSELVRDRAEQIGTRDGD